MGRVALLALVVTVASCADGGSPDGGDGGVLSTYTVSGTVAGAGKAKATLTLQGAAGAPQTTTSSDTGGYQFLEVPPGDYTLTVSQKGFTYTPSSQVVKVNSGAVAVPVITSTSVPSAYAVSGTVSGDVKGGVKLTLSDSTKSFEATTDNTGAYSIPNAPVGTYTLTPSLAGYTFTPQSVPVTVSVAAVTAQNFTAKAVQAATYSVSGTVSGDVKGGVKLTLSATGKSFEATTDAAGAYSIPNAPAGTYTLTPSLTGYTFSPPSRSVTVTGAAITAQDFTAIAPTYAVSGTVSGDVKGGVKLTLSDSTKSFEATTDAAGAYSMPNAPAGTYTLTPSLTGYTFSPPSRSVTVTGAAITAQDFTAIAPTYAVSGTVSGDVKGGVKLTLSDSTKSFEATTDAAGAYSIPNAPAGTYTLTPSLTGYSFLPASRSVTVAGAAVTTQDFGGVTLGWKARSPAGMNTNLHSSAISDDGKYLAFPSGPNVYVSSDYGATWQARNVGNLPQGTALYFVVMSRDGKFIAAIPNYGHIYTSKDYGLTWQVRGSGDIAASLLWKAITISDNGQYLVAGVYPGNMYTSNDFGETWENRSSGVIAGARNWQSIAMSSDGAFVAAVVKGGRVYTSENYGVTWKDNSVAPIDSALVWESIAISSDGKSIAAVTSGGKVYTSKNSGGVWEDKSSRGIPATANLSSVAMTSDGKMLAVVHLGGHIYVSSDFGDTWEDKSSGIVASNLKWQAVAISGDGKYIAAGTDNSPLYTYASP